MINNMKIKMLPAPVNGGFKTDDYWIWCGSVIKGEDGNYHMFASRWKKTVPMHPGWLLQSEIIRAVSSVPEGPYKFCEVVLPERGAQYWDGKSTHNPHIIKIKNTYVLYYMGTTFPFDTPTKNVSISDPAVVVARSNKRIGIACSKSIFGPWIRSEKPILDTRPNGFDSYLTSNSAPCIHPSGKIILMYKGRKDIESTYSNMYLLTASAKSFDSEYIRGKNNTAFYNNNGEYKLQYKVSH